MWLGKEMLEIYDLSGNYTWLESREDFKGKIESIRNSGTWKWVKKHTKQVKRVVTLIMTSEWRILLQKRAHNKMENPWMFDKTIGWHTAYMDSSTMKPWSLNQELSDFNAVKECIEELWIPTTSLSNWLFKDAIIDIKWTALWVITRVERVMWQESRRKYRQWPDFIQPYITDSFIWYYDGSYRFRDWEARWLDTFTIDELTSEIRRNGKNFTDDVKFMIQRYGRYLVSSDKFRERFNEDWGQFTFSG